MIPLKNSTVYTLKLPEAREWWMQRVGNRVKGELFNDYRVSPDEKVLEIGCTMYIQLILTHCTLKMVIWQILCDVFATHTKKAN